LTLAIPQSRRLISTKEVSKDSLSLTRSRCHFIWGRTSRKHLL